MDITVVGAGIVGLTTAHALEDAGHSVQVVAAATGDATTSAVAGAIWLPYRCGPPDQVAADSELTPLLGQVVLVAPGAVDRTISLGDDRGPDPFYLIPRRDELVLGGCSLPYDGDTAPTPDPAITARILAHAATLGLSIGPVLCARVGLRPYRPTVRLERDPRSPRIVHNYGHGGAGFTLGHGCALDVVALATG